MRWVPACFDLLEQVRGLGAGVNDPVFGLADFPIRRRDGSIALLWFGDDEAAILY